MLSIGKVYDRQHKLETPLGYILVLYQLLRGFSSGLVKTLFTRWEY